MNACFHIPTVKCPNCIGTQAYGWAYPIYPQPVGEKCDMCGSTAIDHTEQQCQLNQQFKKIKDNHGTQNNQD